MRIETLLTLNQLGTRVIKTLKLLLNFLRSEDDYVEVSRLLLSYLIL